EAGTLRLIASNGLGRATVEEVEIDLAPVEVLEFTANPTAITQGQPVTLSWRTRMAEEVRLNVPGAAYLREEIAAPYLDVRNHGGTHLPLEASCGGEIATAGCALVRLPFPFPFGDDSRLGARVYTTG